MTLLLKVFHSETVATLNIEVEGPSEKLVSYLQDYTEPHDRKLQS